jgi:hypothetical protein
VFDVATGALQANFFAFEPGFTGGVSIAGGDLGDGRSPAVVVGAGSGGGPRIEVVDASHFTEVSEGGELLPRAVLSNFFAFEPAFRGGVNVAVDGGYVIAGAGVGGGPRVTVFDAATLQPVQSFFAYGPSYRAGVFVAAAGGVLATGTGPGGGGQVNEYQGDGAGPAGVTLKTLTAYSTGDPTTIWSPGVRVAVTVDAAQLLLVTGPGPGSGGPNVIVRDATSLAREQSFYAFDQLFGGGVFVG